MNLDQCSGWGCTHQCSGGIWSPNNAQCDAPTPLEQEEDGYALAGGGVGPYCGTPGSVSAETAEQDAQAVAFSRELQGECASQTRLSHTREPHLSPVPFGSVKPSRLPGTYEHASWREKKKIRFKGSDGLVS